MDYVEKEMRDVAQCLNIDTGPQAAAADEHPTSPLQQAESDEELGDSEDEMEDGPVDVVALELQKYVDLHLGRRQYEQELRIWKDDPTSFWCARRQEFPLLSRVWVRIGSIKGTSCGVEKDFLLGWICFNSEPMEYGSCKP